MWSYNFSLAVRSLKERPGLTLLMILAMATGLGLYVTFYTMFKNGAEIPHANKASQLHLVQMDNRELSADPIERAISAPDSTYQDVKNLINADMPAKRQTFVFRSFGVLSVDDDNIRPINTRSAATTADFFPMFDAPFLFGGSWSKEADLSGDAVIVIGKTMNERLFGGENSVGRMVRLNNQPMQIVGVLNDWHISWRIYDRGYHRGYPHDYFVPAQYALNQNLLRDTRFDCWSTEQAGSRQFRNEALSELMTNECGWLALWAEFEPAQKQDYQQKLHAYIEQQRSLGRFPRETTTFLFNIEQQMEFLTTNYGGSEQVLMAQLFFAVCLLNAIGILMAKFVRRSKEVCLRRALGARKGTIIIQHVMEVVMMGIISGLLGILIALAGLQGMIKIRLYASDYTVRLENLLPYFQLDWGLISYAFAVSIICALIVSIYPIWRVASQTAAGQLKAD